jgi:two-component system chemotaxis response regulator CheB
MPAFINEAVAGSLARAWWGEARLAADGDVLEDGLLLLAPSERHCVLIGNRRIALVDGEKVNFCRPSIDVTMGSVEAVPGISSTGVLLTGMGRDGARGLLHMRDLGARTVVQDEASSAVYGMPAEAVRLGAAEYVLAPRRIAELLTRGQGRIGDRPDVRWRGEGIRSGRR